MARYIDADALIKEMQQGKYANPCNDFQRGVNASIDIQITGIMHMPTADVVPKQAYLEYEETTGLKKAKQEVAREIFAEIDKTIFADMDFFKELKKKYKEGE
jgi:hypothetical protein